MMRRYRSVKCISRKHFARIALISGIALSGFLLGCADKSQFEREASFYPMPPDIPRIQFLAAITDEGDIGAERNSFMEFVTGKTAATKVIARPWDVDHEAGRLYIVDKTFRRVLIVNLEEKKFESMGGKAAGPLLNPGGIFVSSNGYKYVADRDRKQIIVFDRSNEFSRIYEAGPEFSPVDVVVDGNRVYACDVGEENIKIFDRISGEVTDVIDQYGDENLSFRLPTHLTIDDRGNLYVTDFLNFRVQKFDREGKFVRTIGEPGDFPGAMPRPKGIAVDRSNHLYAVDSAFEVVQIFDVNTGDVLMPFGKFGSMSGGTWLPAGVHVDYDNLAYFSEYIDPRLRAEYLIYVVNQAGPFKLNVYAFGEWTGAESLPGVRSGQSAD